MIESKKLIASGAVLPMHSILAAGAVLNKVMTNEKSIYAGIPAKRIGEVKIAIN